MGRLAEFITDLGDGAVTLSLSVAVLGYLAAFRWFRAALRWGLAVAGCGIVTAVAKVGFLACGAGPFQAALHSPSGHTAMSAMVYGGLAALVAVQLRREWVALPFALANLLIMAIALSRIAVLAHSPLEVMVGLAIGTLFATLFAVTLEAPSPALPPLHRLLVVVAVVLVATHGFRFQIESWLQSLAVGLRGVMPLCP